VYAKCQLEGSERPVNEILVICHKNGTLILLQCSKLSHLMRNFDASMGGEDRITWIHGALGRESELGRVLRHHVAQSIIVGGVAAFAVSKGLGSALAHSHLAYQDAS
jgi:hypothetical protein